LISRISLLGAVCLLGCGGGNADDPDLGEVTGVVSVAGKPLANAVVTFTPADGRPSFGETDEDGNYELLFKADNPGAVVGQHTVRVEMISADDVDAADGRNGADTGLPPTASDGSITHEVKAGSNEIDIKL
jgi:hypothetical protein